MWTFWYCNYIWMVWMEEDCDTPTYLASFTNCVRVDYKKSCPFLHAEFHYFCEFGVICIMHGPLQVPHSISVKLISWFWLLKLNFFFLKHSFMGLLACVVMLKCFLCFITDGFMFISSVIWYNLEFIVAVMVAIYCLLSINICKMYYLYVLKQKNKIHGLCVSLKRLKMS